MLGAGPTSRRISPSIALLAFLASLALGADRSGAAWAQADVAKQPGLQRGTSQGESWQLGSVTTSQPLWLIVMTPNDTGWASGPGVMLSYANGNWQTLADPEGNSAVAISLVSNTEWWGIGGGSEGGGFLHYTNGSFQATSIPTFSIMNAIAAVSSNEAWAVGDNSTIAHYLNGTVQIVPIVGYEGSNFYLTGVSMVSPTEGWAVGYDYGNPGVILHYIDGAWQVYNSSGAFPALNSLAKASSNELWAGTDIGQLVHYLNGTWQFVSTGAPSTEAIWSISMVSPSEGWAVGTGGTILHYINGSWQLAPSPTTNDLLGVSMVSATEGWAVGEGPPSVNSNHGPGFMLHYTTTPPETPTSTSTPIPTSTTTSTPTSTPCPTATLIPTATPALSPSATPAASVYLPLVFNQPSAHC